MRKIIHSIAVILCALTPLSVFAAEQVTTNKIEDIIAILINLFVNVLNPILVALSLLFFLWGIAQFIWNASNDKKREEGKRIMWLGIIALFVMLSITGIIGMLQNTFNLKNDPIPVPSGDPCQYGLDYGGCNR